MSRTSNVEAKMAPWLQLYLDLGPERSLAKCHKRGVDGGIESPPTIKTLARWSVRFDWVKRAEARDREEDQRVVDFAVRDLLTMDQRHMEQAKVLQSVGKVALEALVDAEGKGLRPGEALRMLVEGAKLERLVAGKATEIIDVQIDSINALLLLAQAVFLEVIRHAEEHLPEERLEYIEATFMQGMQDGATRFLAERGVDLGDVQQAVA